MKWKPKPYQSRIVKHILTHPAAAVWARVGSGKTSATLAAVEVMRQKANYRALVIAPKHVALNVWAQEAEKWDAFKHLRVAVLHGAGKERALKEKADLYVINYDGLAWLARTAPRGWWPEVLVLDESSKCRNTDTQRFKLLRDQIAPAAKRRIALSGTPMPNGYANLFGQYRLLDDGKRLGKFITHFRMKYCYQTGYGGYKWEILPGAEKTILDAVNDITIEVSADDLAGQLPEVVVRDVEIDLPKPAWDAYRKLERDFIAQLKEGKVTAVNAASLTAKLRQLVSGSIYTEHPDWEVVHAARLDALDALLEEATGPVLCFYEFDHEAQTIVEQFESAEVFNWKSDAQRTKLIKAWNAREVPLMLAHPASAAHGLNLQHGGNTLVWYSLLYDLELYDQAIGRLARTGQQADQVWVHRFVTPGSVDDAMIAAIDAKGAGQEGFLAALREMYAGR